MRGRSQVRELVVSQLVDFRCLWTLGTFGGIATIARESHEPSRIKVTKGMAKAVTARGAIRFHSLAGVRPIASETASREGWNHRVAFCLPRNECAMNRRLVITEVGPDTDAIREQDRGAILFDLGLGIVQADVCVRSADPEVVAVLRAAIGSSILAPDNSTLSVIRGAGLHHVFNCRFARLEIFRAALTASSKSPGGPRTHVMPKLLRLHRTHAATEPIPEGWVPCAHVFPPHPLKDAFGRARPFEPACHGAFQQILREFGELQHSELKDRAIAALGASADPYLVTNPNSRFARNSVRVAVLQWLAATGVTSDVPNDAKMVVRRSAPGSAEDSVASRRTR